MSKEKTLEQFKENAVLRLNIFSRLKRIGILLTELSEAFNSEIITVDMHVSAFDESGEVKEYDFNFHKPYKDIHLMEPIPIFEVKGFLQLMFEKLKFEEFQLKNDLEDLRENDSML